MITIQIFHAAFEQAPRHAANLTSPAAAEPKVQRAMR